MSETTVPPHPWIERVVASEEQIRLKVKELAARINEDYKVRVEVYVMSLHLKDCGTLTVVGILHGAFLFMADLVREISVDLNVQIDFMSVSSYGDESKSSVCD